MSGVLALALQRLALSHGTIPSAVPVGHPANSRTNGTIGTGLGGDLSPLERLIGRGMRVDTGFSWKTRLCAIFADFGR